MNKHELIKELESIIEYIDRDHIKCSDISVDKVNAPDKITQKSTGSIKLLTEISFKSQSD